MPRASRRFGGLSAVANHDLPANAFAKYAIPSRVEARRVKKAEDVARWRDVCRQVDARDGGRCRVCGRRCDPNALALLERGERHHIVYRSRGGEDDAANVVTLCSGCHADQHASRLDVRGSAVDGIEIWRRDEAGQWFLSQREMAVHRIERD